MIAILFGISLITYSLLYYGWWVHWTRNLWLSCYCQQCCCYRQFAWHNRIMIKPRSGFLPVGFLVVDTHPMIILVALGAGGKIRFPIITIKGKHIIHTVITIITIQAFSIHPMPIRTCIHTTIRTCIRTMATNIGIRIKMGNQESQ
jgi:hypothetical protein